MGCVAADLMVSVNDNKLRSDIRGRGLVIKDVLNRANVSAQTLANCRVRGHRINIATLNSICDISGLDPSDYADVRSNKPSVKSENFSQYMNPPIEEEAPRPTFAERMEEMYRDRDTRVTFRTEIVPDKVFDPRTLEMDYEKAWNGLKRWAINQYLDNNTVDIPVVDLLAAIKREEA